MQKSKKILVVALAALCLAGCNKTTTTSNDGGSKEIQVKLYKAGWGEDFLTAEIAAFQEAYKEEGYTVNVVESSSTISESTEGEIETPTGRKKNEIDLYFTNNVSINNIISKSKSILRTSDTTLLEDMDEILDEGAIGADKKEESVKIKDRLYNGFDPMIRYNGSVEAWQGKAFTLPWATSACSLVCNPAVLSADGLTIPLTSNELISDIQTVAAKSGSTGIYPYSWAGSNASGYWNFLYATWFAQYQTIEGYNKFLALTPETGTMKDNGYDVYNDKGILEALKAMDDVLDINYSKDGSTEEMHIDAQHDFLSGKSAFMINGDWLYNEMKAQYADEAKAMQIVKTPILSSIGTECGLTDAELHTVVAAIDAGTAFADIKGVSALTEASYNRIQNARNIYDCLGASHQILIPSYADAKVGAKLFVRFLLSQDGCRIFRNNAYGSLPYRYDLASTDSTCVFQASDDALLNGGKATAFFDEQYSYSELRTKDTILNFNYPSWVSPYTFKSMLIDQTDKLHAQYMYEKEASYEKDNWAAYLSAAGM
jgi:ABC-type glycerol-3-phosphate transport system substrate-binding protein